MNIPAASLAMPVLRQRDTSLQVWRVNKHGTLVAGFADTVITVTPEASRSNRRSEAILDALQPCAPDIALHPLSTTAVNGSVVTVFPRGLALEPSTETYTEALALLKRLHCVQVSPLLPALSNDFLAKGRYCPDTAWAALFEPTVVRLRDDIRCAIADERRRATEAFTCGAFANHPACLIHGDVQIENMIQLNGALRLIDWEDARLDHPLMDIAQFFFANSVPQTDVKSLMAAYSPELQVSDLRLFSFLNFLWTTLFMQNHRALMDAARRWALQHDLPPILQGLCQDTLASFEENTP
ncbi:phosphotransferase [Rhodovulum sulfidophilum]|uniref:Phosphotransferase n=1 Tax=Rhodovulum sulfidophilum TaxID=35806 RepID=A0ABS1RWY5_RHOSU|nr:phosphotransferase [Rhodovulum sulfidophilum]MBL3610585.1 phosphotransferase [Rhodovulum sulfidophilum]MCE8456631.1 phosphotransferase [Rhodovulum sulfidophilum]